MQEHDAVAIALEGDVAAILGNSRTHPRLEQLLDGVDGLGVGWLEKFVFLGALRSRLAFCGDRCA